jgi:hypothetical protein
MEKMALGKKISEIDIYPSPTIAAQKTGQSPPARYSADRPFLGC